MNATAMTRTPPGTAPHARPAVQALACGALALACAACGKADGPAPPAAQGKAPIAAQTAAPTQAANATAQDVARQARGSLSCPPRLATPARASGAPVDDVLGVRPGLAYDEARNLVLCSHELLVAAAEPGRGFNLRAPQAQSLRQGFGARMAEPRVERSSKQVLQDLQRDAMARGANAVREDLQPGQVRWFVSTMGLPGQEKVLAVAREERFDNGQNPTVDLLAAALLKKYGTPTRDERGTPNRMPLLRWAYDPQGQLVTEASPLSHRCVGSSDPNGSLSLLPDCGLVVQALLLPRKDNPALVDRLQVGVVDQAGGYRLVADTEQALQQQDQQRRADEVAKAARQAKPPSL